MGNYIIFFGGGEGGGENPRRGRDARNLTTNVPKILDLNSKSSSEQIFSKNCRWEPLKWTNVYLVGLMSRIMKSEHSLALSQVSAKAKMSILLSTKLSLI